MPEEDGQRRDPADPAAPTDPADLAALTDPANRPDRTPSPRATVTVDKVEKALLAQAKRTADRGGWCLAAAGVMWAYLLWSLVARRWDDLPSCEPLVLRDFASTCGADQWPWLMTVLVLSLPIATTGVILTVRGMIATSLIRHTRASQGRGQEDVRTPRRRPLGP